MFFSGVFLFCSIIILAAAFLFEGIQSRIFFLLSIAMAGFLGLSLLWELGNGYVPVFVLFSFLIAFLSAQAFVLLNTLSQTNSFK